MKRRSKGTRRSLRLARPVPRLSLAPAGSQPRRLGRLPGPCRRVGRPIVWGRRRSEHPVVWERHWQAGPALFGPPCTLPRTRHELAFGVEWDRQCLHQRRQKPGRREAGWGNSRRMASCRPRWPVERTHAPLVSLGVEDRAIQPADVISPLLPLFGQRVEHLQEPCRCARAQYRRLGRRTPRP